MFSSGTSLHCTKDGASDSTLGTHVLNNFESTPAWFSQVPAAEDRATKPSLFTTPSSKHSTRPSNTVVVCVVVGVVVTVVVVVLVLVLELVDVLVVVVLVVVVAVTVVTDVVVRCGCGRSGCGRRGGSPSYFLPPSFGCKCVHMFATRRCRGLRVPNA